MNLNRKPVFTKVDDATPMPFGIYEGKPMAQLPAEYLHHVWHKLHYKDMPWDPLHAYIKHCIPALRKENGDLLWT